MDDGAFSHLYHFAGNEYHLKFEIRDLLGSFEYCGDSGLIYQKMDAGVITVFNFLNSILIIL